MTSSCGEFRLLERGGYGVASPLTVRRHAGGRRLGRCPRGSGRKKLEWTGVGDLAVKYQEGGEAVVGVVDGVGVVAAARGGFRDRLTGEAAGGVAEQQEVRRVLGPGPAADDVDVRVVVAVDVAERE